MQLLMGLLPPSTELEPPPSTSCPSQPEAEVAVQQWALQHGYALSISNSTRDRAWLFLKCHRDGKPRDQPDRSLDERGETAPRKTRRSNRIDCPHAVTIRVKDGRAHVSVTHAEHNHGPDLGISIKEARRMTRAEMELVITEREKDPSIKPIPLLNLINERRTIQGRPPMTETRAISNSLARWKLGLKAAASSPDAESEM